MSHKEESHTRIERRRRQRREGTDRREMVRFEPDKPSRRSGRDRRNADDVWTDRNKF